MNDFTYSTGPVWTLGRDQVIDMQGDFFVWCLQRQRNEGLNSGQKSANIVTDAFLVVDL